MLKKAVKLKKNDGYIIDSLGWAYYKNKNYIIAEKFLQRAVQLKPLDPIINDHYADSLWKLNKNIQARYFWKHVLSLDDTEQNLKIPGIFKRMGVPTDGSLCVQLENITVYYMNKVVCSNPRRM